MIGKVKILVVEDEVSVSRFLQHSLEANNYKVVVANNGLTSVQVAAQERPDLVILDFGLPDISGLEVLMRLREWYQHPIIFLTARGTDVDKVAALDGGADDYLTKPFSVPELLARIRVALRHSPQQEGSPVFTNGVLELDRAAHQVRVSGKELKLTATEYSLLLVLVKHAGKIVPHRMILKEVWGPNAVEHNHYLRVYFGQLRKKLEAAVEGAGQMIENESGVGYRLRIQ